MVTDFIENTLLFATKVIDEVKKQKYLFDHFVVISQIKVFTH